MTETYCPQCGVNKPLWRMPDLRAANRKGKHAGSLRYPHRDMCPDCMVLALLISGQRKLDLDNILAAAPVQIHEEPGGGVCVTVVQDMDAVEVRGSQVISRGMFYQLVSRIIVECCVDAKPLHGLAESVLPVAADTSDEETRAYNFRSIDRLLNELMSVPLQEDYVIRFAIDEGDESAIRATIRCGNGESAATVSNSINRYWFGFMIAPIIANIQHVIDSSEEPEHESLMGEINTYLNSLPRADMEISKDDMENTLKRLSAIKIPETQKPFFVQELAQLDISPEERFPALAAKLEAA